MSRLRIAAALLVVLVVNVVRELLRGSHVHVVTNGHTVTTPGLQEWFPDGEDGPRAVYHPHDAGSLCGPGCPVWDKLDHIRRWVSEATYQTYDRSIQHVFRSGNDRRR